MQKVLLLLVGSIISGLLFIAIYTSIPSKQINNPGAPMSSSVTRYFHVWGKVQNVMFRQTLMRASIKRNLRAAATNLKVPKKDEVEFVLIGNNDSIEEIIGFMKSGQKLNSWGATVTKLEETETGTIVWEDHQVTTDNVDDFKWSKNVEFYI